MSRLKIIYVLVLTFLMVASGITHAQDSLVIRTLGTGEFEESADMIYLSDSNLLVLGNVGSFGPGAGDVLLARYDADLNLLWSNIYGSEFPEIATVVAEVDTGIFLIGGRSNAFPPLYEAFVAVIDSNGLRLDGLRIGGRNDFSEVRAILPRSNGMADVIYNEWSISDSSDRRVHHAIVEWDNNGQLAEVDNDLLPNTEGFDLEKIRPSLDSHWLAVGRVHDTTIDAYCVKWDSNFQEVMSFTFKTDGEDSYSAVADHPDLIMVGGYTTGYNEADRDIILHKYTQAGILYDEDVRGYDMNADNRDDEITDLVLVDSVNFLVSGFTRTFGTLGSEDMLLTRTDTSFFDAAGSTTLGDGGLDIGLRALPRGVGLLMLGTTETYGRGLTDILIVERDSFTTANFDVREVPDSLMPDSSFLILNADGPVEQNEPVISIMNLGHEWVIQAPDGSIESVKCYDLNGRLLLEEVGQKRSETRISNPEISNQVIILSVQGEDWQQSRLIFVP